MDVKVGSVVSYVMEWDSDTSYSPNIGPAIVTKINDDGMSGVGNTLDLVVFAMNGMFYKFSAKEGDPKTRMTWFRP
jgi:hypothetical protein